MILKDHETLKTGVMILKIQLWSQQSDILKYITIENSYFQLQYYFTILQFYCIFNQINAALVSIKDFFQKH